MSELATPLPAAPPAKETKAQKSERLKLEKNPWEAWEEVRQYAREGRASLPAAWAEFYMKWWGVYTQGDGVGRDRRHGRGRQGDRVLHDADRDAERAANLAPAARHWRDHQE